MSEVKVYRVNGEILKHNYSTPFSKELRSTTPEAAVENVYANLGSQHRVKRVHIRIDSVEEIKPEEITDLIVRQLTED